MLLTYKVMFYIYKRLEETRLHHTEETITLSMSNYGYWLFCFGLFFVLNLNSFKQTRNKFLNSKVTNTRKYFISNSLIFFFLIPNRFVKRNKDVKYAVGPLLSHLSNCIRSCHSIADSTHYLEKDATHFQF